MTLYALDGTGNWLGGGPSKWTHVALMAAAHGRSTAVTAINGTLPVEGAHVMYQRGVGTGTKIDRAFGGATGLGAKWRVRKAYQRICEIYADSTATDEDLTIDIIGFSRGAATALHLANVIYLMGIRRPRRRWSSVVPYRTSVGWTLFKDWERLDKHDVDRIRQRVKDVGLPEGHLLEHDDVVVPRIRFLGLYDAVSSFVLPMDTRIIDLQSLGFGFQLHTPPNVAECSHALALDERRKSFRNVRVHPASMQRARSLRSNEVGHGSLAVAVTIIAIWLLYAMSPDSLGSARPWTIVAFIGSIAVAFTHMLLGAFSDRSVPTNATDQSREIDPTKAMAPALGALFALVALALVDWLGGFDSSSIGPWDYGAAVLWAFATATALAITGLVLAVDSTSLRTSDEVIGLSARRLSGLSIAAAWLLVTWWITAVTTGWWDHHWAAPWLSRSVICALTLAIATGFVATYRPTRRLAKQRQGRTMSAMQASDAVGSVAALSGLVVVGAWIIRRIASRSLALTLVPWWQYATAFVGAGVLAGTMRFLQRREGETIPPELEEIYEHFQQREAREVWFRGNHTDIGGGGAPELCDHSLRWMTTEADRAGLKIDLNTIASILEQRVAGVNPNQVGPTFDPLIARARRLVLTGDLGHASVKPSTQPVPEDPRSMAHANWSRLVRGRDLLYDPVQERSGISRAFARRFKSPYTPRFVGVQGQLPDPSGGSFEWVFETSAGLLFEKTQQRSIDRWT